MPVEPEPIVVSGTIDADTVWNSDASPYILDKDVLVKDKSLMTIEPRTKIKSKREILIIRGKLNA
jgi:hypothetical protein